MGNVAVWSSLVKLSAQSVSTTKLTWEFPAVSFIRRINES